MPMTLETLRRLAEAYGADLRRWPEAERQAAKDLCALDPAAKACLQAEADLDDWLNRAPRPQVSDSLRARVMADVPAPRSARRRAKEAGLWAWLSGLGWVAAAFAGVAFGTSMTWEMTGDQQVDAVFYQAGLSVTDDREILGG